MTRPGRLLRVPRGQDGQVTALVIILTTALLLLAGLVGDGARALADKLDAINTAQDAARAGAQALDLTALRTTGQITLDPTAATRAARAYLATTPAAARITGTRVTVTGDRVTVTVRQSDHTILLGLAGLTTITVTGTGTARAELVTAALAGSPQ